MEVFIIILALLVSTAIGAGVGFYVASKWQFYIKVARKEDYEVKILELENMIEKITEQAQVEPSEEYTAYDMFPPNLDPEFGLPRSMKR
jgi:pantothenate kinase